MPTITVKNIPHDTYEKLKQSAKRSHRSINSEIIMCIEKAVRSRRIDLESITASARELRSRTASHPITDRQFTRAKNKG